MSTEIVNLRRAKKKFLRADKEKTAEANRQKFGRSKSEKTISNFEIARDAAKLDGMKLKD